MNKMAQQDSALEGKSTNTGEVAPSFYLDAENRIIRLALPNEPVMRASISDSQKIIDEMIDGGTELSIYQTASTQFMATQFEVGGVQYSRIAEKNNEESDSIIFSANAQSENPRILFHHSNNRIDHVSFEYNHQLSEGSVLEVIHSFTLFGHPTGEITVLQIPNTHKVAIEEGVIPDGFSLKKAQLFNFFIGETIETPNPHIRTWYDVVAHYQQSETMCRYYRVAPILTNGAAKVVDEYAAQELATPTHESTVPLAILNYAIRVADGEHIENVSVQFVESLKKFPLLKERELKGEMVIEKEFIPKSIYLLLEKLQSLIKTRNITIPSEPDAADSVTIELIPKAESTVHQEFGIGHINFSLIPFNNSLYLTPSSMAEVLQFSYPIKWNSATARNKMKSGLPLEITEKIIDAILKDFDLLSDSALVSYSAYSDEGPSVSDHDVEETQRKLGEGGMVTVDELKKIRTAYRKFNTIS